MFAAASSSLWSLFLLFAAAKTGEALFDALRLPGIVGQILAGFLVGPGLLRWVEPSVPIGFLAGIGVIFLLFETGLETRFEEMFEHGWTSVAVAVAGVLTPLGVGWWFAYAVGENAVTERFVGTLLVATSIGITAQVLRDFDALNTVFGRVILGAAVLDDILGLLALSTLQSFAAGAGLGGANLLLTCLFVAGFLLLVWGLRRTTLPRLRRFGRLRGARPQWSLALVVLLAFSALAASVGLSAVIGAFLAGMFVNQTPEIARALRFRAAAVSNFVAPFFLAGVGLHVRAAVFTARRPLLLLAGLTLVAVGTKLAACGLAAAPLGRRTALLVGMGMIPRGEVGIVVADQALRLKAVPAEYYSLGIGMALLTSLLGPLMLRTLLRHNRRPAIAREAEAV